MTGFKTDNPCYLCLTETVDSARQGWISLSSIRGAIVLLFHSFPGCPPTQGGMSCTYSPYQLASPGLLFESFENTPEPSFIAGAQFWLKGDRLTISAITLPTMYVRVHTVKQL